MLIEAVNLTPWSSLQARPLMLDPEKVEDLVDPRLGDAYPFEDLLKVATIANACAHPDPARRPHMGEVGASTRQLDCAAVLSRLRALAFLTQGVLEHMRHEVIER
jgi:hypothetical protein